MNKRILVLLCTFCIMLGMGEDAFAYSEGRESYLLKVRAIDQEFLQNYRDLSESITDLVSPFGRTVAVNFSYNGIVMGYAIIIEDTIVEFAEGESPYNRMQYNEDTQCLYYDFISYKAINKEEVKRISYIPLDSIKIMADRGSSKKLSGVSPQLQGSNNCIVAALGNVIWYWGGHGYSSFTSGKNFTQVKTALDALFPSYANNYVVSVAHSYASNYSCGFTGYANWSPSFAFVKTEINAGYPCMVGFAAGSDYSPTYGHMTMCYGYLVNDSGNYVRLADGHSTLMVTKLWTSYNDCVIKLRVQWGV